MFGNTYTGKRVLVTGHTGFKGSWLSLWLTQLGAKVCGFSLDLPTEPSNFKILGLQKFIDDQRGDIRDCSRLLQVMKSFQPDIVFHLAAQALVHRSYNDPINTFETNSLGTLNVLECMRLCSSAQVGVMITSDKCYRNIEWPWGYRETDLLGGEDPYSASKGCAELIIYSYIKSFFHNRPKIASTRAGNVVGGGDWAYDRIVPDAVRAWSQNKPLVIRNPYATRPWQHVLEPLSGYLWLGARLWSNDTKAIGESFNFGPDSSVNQTVEELLSTLAANWPGANWYFENKNSPAQHESTLLKLCCDKALSILQWQSTLSFSETIAMTAEWYQTYYLKKADILDLTNLQIKIYIDKAKIKKLAWVQ